MKLHTGAAISKSSPGDPSVSPNALGWFEDFFFFWGGVPYPEELKPEEFMAALELLWAVPGLLAWRALPGDEGLLEFPGEHEDVTAWERAP